jgi:hypothetical protein
MAVHLEILEAKLMLRWMREREMGVNGVYRAELSEMETGASNGLRIDKQDFEGSAVNGVSCFGAALPAPSPVS